MPGKETLTGRLANAMHDNLAQKCDTGQDGCFLSDQDRQRLDRLIDKNINIAALKWVQALVDKRLVLLTTKKPGWNALWKIAVVLTMGFLTDGAEIGLEYLAEEVESTTAMRVLGPIINRQESVKGVMEFGSAMVEGHAEEAINEAANETGNEEADVLNTLREQPGDWASSLIQNYPKKLDDYGRLLLYGVTDPEKILTVGHFTKKINELLERWEKQVEEIGTGDPAFHEGEDIIWVWPDDGSGSPRLARVTLKAYDAIGVLEPKTFKGWVDDDMKSMAMEKAKKEDTAFANGGVTSAKNMGQGGIITFADFDQEPELSPEDQQWRRGVRYDWEREEVPLSYQATAPEDPPKGPTS